MNYKDSPHYCSATEQEKKWFDHFYESKDIKAATYAAYTVANDDSARAYGKTVLGREHIAALITEFCTPKRALPTVEELKHKYIEISEDKNATVRDKLTALVAYERLSGFTVKGKPINTPPVDDPFEGIDE